VLCARLGIVTTFLKILTTILLLQILDLLVYQVKILGKSQAMSQAKNRENCLFLTSNETMGSLFGVYFKQALH
jgi:hypothetical protein